MIECAAPHRFCGHDGKAPHSERTLSRRTVNPVLLRALINPLCIGPKVAIRIRRGVGNRLATRAGIENQQRRSVVAHVLELVYDTIDLDRQRISGYRALVQAHSALRSSRASSIPN